MQTTTENTVKNMFETWAEAQKKAMDTISETSEKFQKEFMGSTKNAEATTDYFKKWYDSQMAFFYNNNKENNTTNPMDWFNNWMNNQTEAGKKMSEMNQEWMKNFNNPASMFNNMPGMPEEAKKNMEQSMNAYTSWMNTMTGTYNDMMKNFGTSNNKDYFSNMFNNADSYMKMYQLMMPVMKAMQDKTYTPEQFGQLFNMSQYKDMMDKMFGFAPDSMKNMFSGFNNPFQDYMTKAMDMSKGMYDNMKNMMSSNMPSFMQDPFNSYLSNYQNIANQLQNASNPFAKMMTPGADKDQLAKLGELSNRFNVYQVRNSQMQYMIYTAGMKAMETLSQNLFNKMKDGEEMKSFTVLYSEMLNTMDKAYVELFETEEYSKIQSELSSVGLRMKKDIEGQMERVFANVPLIPRSEMDELYKTIHDLKTRIRLLEKQIDGEFEVSVSESKEAKASSSTKKSKNA